MGTVKDLWHNARAEVARLSKETYIGFGRTAEDRYIRAVIKNGALNGPWHRLFEFKTTHGSLTKAAIVVFTGLFWGFLEPWSDEAKTILREHANAKWGAHDVQIMDGCFSRVWNDAKELNCLCDTPPKKMTKRRNLAFQGRRQRATEDRRAALVPRRRVLALVRLSAIFTLTGQRMGDEHPVRIGSH